MAIRKSRDWWFGDGVNDIAEYLGEYSADGCPADRVQPARCASCSGQTFSLRVDDEEGCAKRTCVDCGTCVLVFDSADTVEDATLDDVVCPCNGKTFNVAGGFAFRDDGEVRWVYLGLRCVADGVLGCVAEWKIDYAPTQHLLTQV